MVGKKQKVKFEAYVAYTHNSDGKLALLDITDFLFSILKKNSKTRTLSQYGVPTRMDQVDDVTIDDATLKKNPKIKLTYFHMAKLREDGIAITKKDVDELEDLDLDDDEFIAEDINCIFDSSNCVLFIQRNYHSLSITGVTDYLKRMHKRIEKKKEGYDKEKFKDYDIFFEPVANKEIMKKVIAKDNFRTLSLSFARTNVQNLPGKLSKLLGGLGEVFEDLGGKKIGITLNAGDSKSETLTPEEIRKVAKEVGENHTLFSSAIVRGKSKDTPVEKFDLLNGKLYTEHKFSTVKKATKGKAKKIHLDPKSVRSEMEHAYLKKDDIFEKPFRDVVIINV